MTSGLPFMMVDPGKRIGIAIFDRKTGALKKRWATDLDGLTDALVMYTPSVVGVEDFALRHNRAQQQIGSRFEASQVIGACKAYARVRTEHHGTFVHFFVQSVDGLYIGSMLEGNGPLDPKKHVEDSLSAYYHGVYWLVGEGILEPAPID